MASRIWERRGTRSSVFFDCVQLQCGSFFDSRSPPCSWCSWCGGVCGGRWRWWVRREEEEGKRRGEIDRRCRVQGRSVSPIGLWYFAKVKEKKNPNLHAECGLCCWWWFLQRLCFLLLENCCAAASRSSLCCKGNWMDLVGKPRPLGPLLCGSEKRHREKWERSEGLMIRWSF